MVRTPETRKPRMTRKGAKSRKCRKDERAAREKGKTGCEQPKKTGRR